MKKFTFMLIAALTAVIAYSQATTPLKPVPAGLLPKGLVETPVAMDTKQMNKQPQVKALAQKRAIAVADIAGTYVWEYKTANDRALDLTTIETTDGFAFVTITVAAGDTVTISGMFPNDLTAIVNTAKGTITIPGYQKGGTSSYGDYIIQGLFFYEGDQQYNPGWYYKDIEGTIDAEGNITIVDWIARILQGGDYDGYSLTPYWVAGSTLTKSEIPTVVELPEGVVMEEYAMSYTDYNQKAQSTSIALGFDGNDAYMSGFSTYIPTALIKGTKAGDTLTFAANQYLGSFNNLEAYFVSGAVFTYDKTSDSYSAEGDVYSLLGEKYIDFFAKNPVLKKVVEKAATPANPTITEVKNGNYGYYILFNVPNVDIEGNGLVTSKLFFQFFTEINKEVAPLTFTPATHFLISDSMSIIPFGFTDNYDFYSDQIFLNNLYSANWDKLGIKSIYNGGNETHETEIQWYDIKLMNGISSVSSTSGAEARYFDLQGRAANSSTKGLLIKQVRDAQGNMKTVKVLRK